MTVFPTGVHVALWRCSTLNGHLGFTTISGGLTRHCPASIQHQSPNPCHTRKKLASPKSLQCLNRNIGWLLASYYMTPLFDSIECWAPVLFKMTEFLVDQLQLQRVRSGEVVSCILLHFPFRVPSSAHRIVARVCWRTTRIVKAVLLIRLYKETKI